MHTHFTITHNTIDQILLNAMALIAVVSGMLVITVQNPVISVLFLITVFVSVAGYLLIVGIGFIGLSYIVVYVGAVTVLFLFVIMMLNLQLDQLNATGALYTQSLPIAFLLGTALLFQLVIVLDFKPQTQPAIESLNDAAYKHLLKLQHNNTDLFHTFYSAPDLTATPVSGLQVQSLAVSLYTHGATWLILLSFVLLLAMVSPIVLTMRRYPHLLLSPPLQKTHYHTTTST